MMARIFFVVRRTLVSESLGSNCSSTRTLSSTVKTVPASASPFDLRVVGGGGWRQCYGARLSWGGSAHVFSDTRAPMAGIACGIPAGSPSVTLSRSLLTPSSDAKKCQPFAEPLGSRSTPLPPPSPLDLSPIVYSPDRTLLYSGDWYPIGAKEEGTSSTHAHHNLPVR